MQTHICKKSAEALLFYQIRQFSTFLRFFLHIPQICSTFAAAKVNSSFINHQFEVIVPFMVKKFRMFKITPPPPGKML